MIQTRKEMQLKTITYLALVLCLFSCGKKDSVTQTHPKPITHNKALVRTFQKVSLQFSANPAFADKITHPQSIVDFYHLMPALKLPGSNMAWESKVLNNNNNQYWFDQNNQIQDVKVDPQSNYLSFTTAHPEGEGKVTQTLSMYPTDGPAMMACLIREEFEGDDFQKLFLLSFQNGKWRFVNRELMPVYSLADFINDKSMARVYRNANTIGLYQFDLSASNHTIMISLNKEAIQERCDNQMSIYCDLTDKLNEQQLQLSWDMTAQKFEKRSMDPNIMASLSSAF